MSSLRYKIGFSYFLLVCITLASSVVALYNFLELKSSVGQLMRENYQSVLAAEHMSKALEEQNQAQEALGIVSVPLGGTRPVMTNLADELESTKNVFNKNRDDFILWYRQATDSVKVALKPAVLDSIFVRYTLYLADSDSLFKILEARVRRGVARNYQQKILRPIVAILRGQCSRFLQFNQAAISSADQRAQEASNNSAFAYSSLRSLPLCLSSLPVCRFREPSSGPPKN